MPIKIWTDEEKVKVLDLFNNKKLSYSEIAERFNVSRSAVSGVIQRAKQADDTRMNIRRMPAERKPARIWSQQEIDLVLKFHFENKMSYKDISARTGLSTTAICNFLTKHKTQQGKHL